MAEHPELESATPFVPSARQLEHMPEFRNNNIPRYLFRIHAPPSAGTTTTSCVIPPASSAADPELRADIFSHPPGPAGDILHDHFKWTSSHEGTCNLISWTSSLLVALQFGFYRHGGSWNSSLLSEIRLLILDTRGLPEGTFIKDVEIMRALAPDLPPEAALHDHLSLRERRTGAGRYYFGEYLSQGDLGIEGRCAEAPMDSLIYFRLFDLQPGFGDEAAWARWANRVLSLRVPFIQLGTFPPIVPPTDQDQIRRAIVLASACFGDRFAVPVALMLLALRPRQRRDRVIINGFAAMFTSK